jgi:hypothetical protein
MVVANCKLVLGSGRWFPLFLDAEIVKRFRVDARDAQKRPSSVTMLSASDDQTGDATLAKLSSA